MQFFGELEGIINWVIDTYGEYLTRCQQLCSANNTTHLFNAFFAESIMEEYKDNMSYAPWIRCPLALLSLQNFITGQYGEKEIIIERAAIIVSQINPVNGNLISVENFYDDIMAVQDLLNGIKTQAENDQMVGSDYWYSVEETKTYSCELSIKGNSSYNDENGVYPIETSGCGEGLGIDLETALAASAGFAGVSEEVDWTQMNCEDLKIYLEDLLIKCTAEGWPDDCTLTYNAAMALYGNNDCEEPTTGIGIGLG